MASYTKELTHETPITLGLLFLDEQGNWQEAAYPGYQRDTVNFTHLVLSYDRETVTGQIAWQTGAKFAVLPGSFPSSRSLVAGVGIYASDGPCRPLYIYLMAPSTEFPRDWSGRNQQVQVTELLFTGPLFMLAIVARHLGLPDGFVPLPYALEGLAASPALTLDVEPEDRTPRVVELSLL